MTAIFPVKTLDSLTVVATPTAPTCLVGGTTSVALVVTANYLTGTATSEAVVTTYTTGSNWANGVFTAATTVAGTENIVVSYTEGGVTKTANVAVTVSVEAPKVTTVTVTAISLVENASATAEVVVKDQTGATMTTGYTLTYAMSNSVATVATTGVVTAGAYNSSSTTGTLTVTATPTTGTAVTGTATVTVSADATKPTLVSASATNSKTILVTYSKKVKDSSSASDGALNPANYSLFSDATGVTTSLVSGAPAATQIQATLVFADTTKTVVKIYLSAVGASVSGYPAGGLDSKAYRVYVSNVVDTAATPNAIINNSNVSFTGTTTPDSAPPKLVALTYNKGTGLITMTFDKAVTNAATYTKIKFNGVALSAAGSVGSALTSKIEYTVSSNDKTTIAALTGTITVTLEAGAVNDTSSPAIANELTTMEPTLTVPPSLTSAVYDETANKLTLGFDQTINLTNSSFLTNSNFQLKSTEMAQFAIDATDTLVTTANGPTIEIMLSSTHISSMEGVSTHTSLKIYVKADAVESASATKNLQQDDTTGYPAVSVSVVKDTVKPAVSSITYNESTKKLVFNFNVAVQASFTGSNVSLKSSADDAEKDNLDSIPVVSNGTALEFDLSGTAAAVTTFVTNIKAIQQGILTADTPNTYDAYFTFAADVFTKSGSATLKNVAVSSKATATTVVYTDNVVPGYDTLTATNKAAVTVVFNEKLDKTAAETAANYKIYNTSTNASLTVYTATMTDSTTTKKTVVLYTDAQTNGDTYRLDTLGVKDIASTPNTITTAIQKTFTGVSTSVTTPVISTVTIEDKDGSGTLTDGDQFKITFNEPVKFNVGSYTDLNNVFELDLDGVAGGETVLSASTVSLSKMTADATDYKVLYLTYNTASPAWTANIVPGTSTLNIKAAAQTYIVHKYDTSTAALKGTAISINPPGDRAAISTVTIEDVNNNALVDKGDKIYVTFNKQVKRAAGTALLATDFSVYLNGAYGAADATPFGTLLSTDFSSSITNTAYGTTATLTVGSSGTINVNPTQLGLGVRVAMDAAGRVVDSWGVGNAAYVNDVTDAAKLTYKTITGKNTIAAPQVQSVQFVDVDSNGSGSINDYLVYTFNVPVYINAGIGTVAGQWVLGTGTLANNPASAPAYLMDSDHTKVKVVLGGNESIFTGVTVSDIKASHADFATSVKIANFNGSKPSANGSGLVVSADTTSRPAVSSVEYISVNKIKIKFDRAIVLASADVTKMLLHNNGAVVDTTSGAGEGIALDANDTTNVTLIWTVSDAAGSQQDAFVTTGFGTDASITGLGIASGSGIKAASSGLEVAAFGATTSSADHKKVAADTTAPDAFTTTQLEKVAYDNVNLKVTSSAALTPTEKVRVEVYIGADTPSKVAGTYTAYNAYVAPGAGWDGGAADPLIASVVGAAVPVTHKVFYRFKDVAGNISDWAQRGTVGLPAGTYKKVAATSTVAGEAVVSNTNTLVVGNGTTTTSYDITNNATVKNLMTNLVASDTFTVDSSSLISAIASTNLTAPATITLTAADLASTVAITGDNDQLLTVAGTATSKTVTFAAANGGYTLTATGATVATIAGASTGTIKIGAAVTTVNVNAAVTNLDIAANVTTLNTSAAIATLTATAAATVTTLTAASGGSVTANTGAGNLTITNIDQSAVAADVSVALGNMTTTITSIKGHATNKLTLTTAAASTLNVASGNVDLSGCASSTLNVVATGATKVTATGRTLAAVSGAQTIEIAGATAATVGGAVTTLTISGAVTTLTATAAITTLNVSAAITNSSLVTGTNVAVAATGNLAKGAGTGIVLGDSNYITVALNGIINSLVVGRTATATGVAVAGVTPTTAGSDTTVAGTATGAGARIAKDAGAATVTVTAL